MKDEDKIKKQNEYRQLLEQLQKKHALLTAVLEQMPFGVIIAEAPTGRYIMGNNKVAEIWKHPFLSCTSVEEYSLYKGFHREGSAYQPGEWPLARSIQAGEVILNEEIDFLRGDGTRGTMRASSSPIRNQAGKIIAGVTLFSDVSKFKLFGKELVRLERLKLVGRLAAGIGHEIRNPMTTVRGFLQILGRKQEFTRYKRYFTLMIEELDRANSIISEFISLAKDRPVNLKAQSLNHIVNTLSPLLAAEAMNSGKYINMALEDIPDLLLDEKEIRQLILNLVRNGLEAMQQGGIMNMRTFSEGTEVVLAFEDQGRGIEPGVLDKIGTPFFSTKNSGTGLGLAICYSIAARHNAAIKVKTSPAGTTFFVRFKS